MARGRLTRAQLMAIFAKRAGSRSQGLHPGAAVDVAKIARQAKKKMHQTILGHIQREAMNRFAAGSEDKRRGDARMAELIARLPKTPEMRRKIALAKKRGQRVYTRESNRLQRALRLLALASK
jgi:hypothetical protein